MKLICETLNKCVRVPFQGRLADQADNNIHMTKVQQKISACFRSLDNAQIFCRICSCFSCCKHNDFILLI
ncbi:MAG: hypothetical protein EXR81_05445 [Gammaproteobacteria bacterium]|nr:hypothetical protein [Gammaproteobacteria bacterium]